MPTVVSQVTRTIVIKGTTAGVDKATAQMKELAGAEGQVVVAQEKVARSTLSMEGRLRSLQRQVDLNYKADQSLAAAARTLAGARATGMIDAAEETRLLDLARVKYAAIVPEMAKLGHGAASNTSQIMALTHVMRSMTEQIALGVSPTQALTAQFSHLSYIMSAPGGLSGAFGGLAGMLAPALPIIVGIGAAAAVVATVFAGMTYEINKTAKTQVSFGNVFMATMQVAAESIGNFFKPALDQLGKWFGQFIDWIAPTFKDAVNGLIGDFVFAFTAIRDTWSLLPAAMGDIVLQSVNNVISGVQGMINATIDLLNNTFIKPIQQSLSSIGVNIGTIGKVNFGSGIANPFAGSATKVGGIISADASSAFSTDYAGQAFNAIGKRAQALALADATEKAGKKAKGANDDFKKLAHDGLSEAEKSAQKLAQTLEQTLGGAVSSLFSGPVTSLQDGIDKVLKSFAGLGQQNLSKVFDGMLGGAANDNNGVEQDGSWVGKSGYAKVLESAVRDGTKGGFGDLLKNIPGGAGTAAAGLGGLGVGYSTQNPLMGALGGAISGMSAGPIGAVVGGIAGLIGGLFGMNEELQKSKAALNDNRSAIDQFIAAGLGKSISEDAVAIAQFKQQGAQLIKLAEAAGDSGLVRRIKEAEAAYGSTLKAEHVRTDFKSAQQDLIDAYTRQADGLQSVIDRTKDFITSIGAFREGLKLDKTYSTLSPQRMLAEAQRNFDLISKKARLGDATAQGQLQGAATSYLDAAHGYLGSSSGYASVFDRVQNVLGTVAGAAGTQLSSAEKQLAATHKQLKALGDVQHAVLSVEKAIAKLEKVEAAAAKLAGVDAARLRAEMAALNKKLGIAALKKAS